MNASGSHTIGGHVKSQPYIKRFRDTMQDFFGEYRGRTDDLPDCYRDANSQMNIS